MNDENTVFCSESCGERIHSHCISGQEMAATMTCFNCVRLMGEKERPLPGDMWAVVVILFSWMPFSSTWNNYLPIQLTTSRNEEKCNAPRKKRLPDDTSAGGNKNSTTTNKKLQMARPSFYGTRAPPKASETISKIGWVLSAFVCYDSSFFEWFLSCLLGFHRSQKSKSKTTKKRYWFYIFYLFQPNLVKINYIMNGLFLLGYHDYMTYIRHWFGWMMFPAMRILHSGNISQAWVILW